MAKERKSFLLRIDPKLHDALRRWADDDFRSLNAQTEMILRRALLDAGRLKEVEEGPASPEEPPSADAAEGAPGPNEGS